MIPVEDTNASGKREDGQCFKMSKPLILPPSK